MSVEFAILGGELSIVVVVLYAEDVAETFQHLLDRFFEDIEVFLSEELHHPLYAAIC